MGRHGGAPRGTARRRRRPRRRSPRAHALSAVTIGLVATLAVALALGACTGSDETSESEGGSNQQEADVPTNAGPPDPDKVATPTVQGPITGGAGAVVLGPPRFDVAGVGYVQEEYFLSGTAEAYTSDEPLAEDGRWTVTPSTTEPFTTRIVVRRPSDPAAFSGTVVVEWLDVTGGRDADPDWTCTHDQIIRSGAAWVGVSAQQLGIVGDGDSVGSALALQTADPARYGGLVHPGDDYSYDIFSQAGAAVWNEAATVLGGLEPTVVLAVGESQSAFRLTSYINAVAPLSDVYDGFLVHSRAAQGAPLATTPTEIDAPDPTRSRTDLTVPVFVLSSETDLVGELAYARARQASSRYFASWEVAGTAHGDAYSLGIGDTDDGGPAADLALFEAMSAPPESVYFGIIECDAPINTGPHTYVARSVLAKLEAWAVDGTRPPEMPRLQVIDSGDEYVLGPDGIVLGGVRTPHVDVPVAVLSGLGQDGESSCGLFGTTVPFTDDQLAEAYPDHATFVTAWNRSVDAAVSTGAILEVDAARLRAVAEASSIGT